jgi:hypothetical protein
MAGVVGGYRELSVSAFIAFVKNIIPCSPQRGVRGDEKKTFGHEYKLKI